MGETVAIMVSGEDFSRNSVVVPATGLLAEGFTSDKTKTTFSEAPFFLVYGLVKNT